ncbi:hypothetical protein [Campylobacter jejuni]|nr:hypothetical protein [Campylobacter jejuni]
MKKIILFLLLFNFLFAEGTNNGQGVVSETTKEEMQKIFSNRNDDIETNDGCS